MGLIDKSVVYQCFKAMILHSFLIACVSPSGACYCLERCQNTLDVLLGSWFVLCLTEVSGMSSDYFYENPLNIVSDA